MSIKSHLDADLFSEKLSHVFDFFHFKIILSLFIAYVSCLFNNQYNVLIGLFILIALDTLTGVWCAIRTKEVSSRGFYRATVKCLVYFIMLLVARIVDKSVPLPFASIIMDSFLVITESISILENIGKLGFMVPQVLISKLKALQKVEKKDE